MSKVTSLQNYAVFRDRTDDLLAQPSLALSSQTVHPNKPMQTLLFSKFVLVGKPFAPPYSKISL